MANETTTTTGPTAAATASSAPAVASNQPATLPAVDPIQILVNVLQGLERVARSEASQTKPSARDWHTFRQQLLSDLSDLGAGPRAAPQVTAPQHAGARPAPQHAGARPKQMLMRNTYARREARPPGAPSLKPAPKAK